MVFLPDQKSLAETLKQLPQPKDAVQCEYVWIDGSLKNFRTKSKTWPTVPQTPDDLPLMEFCGSATDFDVGNVADYYAKPVKLYRDPFREGVNKLVFCETYSRERLPTFANNRYRLLASEQKIRSQIAKCFFHQPYTLLRSDGKLLCHLNPAYSAESESGFECGREIAEAHYRACLYAGVNMSSLEPFTNKGQWRFGIGQSSYISLGDDVWMSRFILERVAEDFGVTVSFDASPTKTGRYPVSASLILCSDNAPREERQRIVEALFSKFILKEEQPLKIVSPSDKILLSHISSDVDPYSMATKILDALNPVT